MELKERGDVITYVVYDKVTGRIVHTHRRFDAVEEQYRECDPAEVKNLIVGDSFAMSKVTDGNPANLEVTVSRALGEGFSRGRSGLLFDLKTKAIIPKPRLVLTSDKATLNGDGKDQAKITLQVVDSKGQVEAGFQGQVKVSTSRGKLSTPGGVVQVTRGLANLTLTSVKETVSRVTLEAACLEGKCLKGWLELEFL